jgi:hypothetical protein
MEENPVVLDTGFAYVIVARNTILSLEAYIPDRGYGTDALQKGIAYIREQGYTHVLLDDMSDRYRKLHNIYVNHGFRYVHEHGPEMVLDLI